MRGDRLLAILLILQGRGRTTAERLAEDLGVSVRTVYRDLAALGSAGVPVCTTGGPSGGCWLMDGYRTGLTGLTADEATALVRLGLPGPLRDLGLSSTMASIHRKVSAAQPGLEGDGARFLVDAPPWFKRAEEVQVMPTLVEAVHRGRDLRIRHSREDPSSTVRESTVDALGLVCKAGTWYLVARSRDRVTAYRASRILSVELGASEFTRPAGFDLAEFWRQWSRDFEESRPRVEVVVRVAAEMIPTLPEVFGDGIRPAMDKASAPDRDGSRITTLTFESIPAAAYRLIGFGDALEVLEPRAVREKIAKTAASALRLYAPGDPTQAGPIPIRRAR